MIGLEAVLKCWVDNHVCFKLKTIGGDLRRDNVLQICPYDRFIVWDSFHGTAWVENNAPPSQFVRLLWSLVDSFLNNLFTVFFPLPFGFISLLYLRTKRA